MFSLREQGTYLESSQTTTMRIENLLRQDCLALGFFDIYSPAIQRTTGDVWEAAAHEILQEHGELWERLAQL